MSGILIYYPLPSEHQMSLAKKKYSSFFPSLCFPEIDKLLLTIFFGKIQRYIPEKQGL